MAGPDEGKGMSGWWLAVIGAVLLTIGVVLFILDSAGVVDAHSYSALVISPVAAGILLLVMGTVMGVKGTRVENDGRNRYGRLMNKNKDGGGSSSRPKD
jgi:hypothetical protein